MSLTRTTSNSTTDTEILDDFDDELEISEPPMIFRKILLDNGTSYVGMTQNGLYSGKGVLTIPGHSVYTGMFYMNAKHGLGTITYCDGNIYTGMWMNDKKNGNGRFTWVKKKEIYDGLWKDDSQNGSGKFTYNGNTFMTCWNNGQLVK